MTKEYVLYYRPGAYSRPVHIMLREMGVKYSLELVDFKNKTLDDGSNYNEINPRGQVPALKLPNGSILTQTPAILLYLGSVSRNSAFNPKDLRTRTRLLEALGMLGDIHWAFIGVMRASNQETRKDYEKLYASRLQSFEDYLVDSWPFVLGNQYSQADMCAAVLLSWAKVINLDTARYPKFELLKKRVYNRPAVQKVLKIESTRPVLAPSRL